MVRNPNVSMWQRFIHRTRRRRREQICYIETGVRRGDRLRVDKEGNRTEGKVVDFHVDQLWRRFFVLDNGVRVRAAAPFELIYGESWEKV